MKRANLYARRLGLDVDKSRILGEILGQAFVQGVEVGFNLEDRPELSEKDWLAYVVSVTQSYLPNWLLEDTSESVE